MKTSVFPSFPGGAWERAIEALPLVENGARYELKPTKNIVILAINYTLYDDNAEEHPIRC